MSALVCLTSIAPLAPETDVWFTDIWGVMHNGVAPCARAVDACETYRRLGGRVILVSNSPRLSSGVQRQLDDIGVARDAYDDIVTSGGVSRQLISKWSGSPVFHIGPQRDVPVFEGLAIDLASADASAGIVCTGLFDDECETPADYSELLGSLRRRNIPMICANPDQTVLRGARTIYCAGAIAAAYEAMGAEVRYAGKPYIPIYDAAMACAARLTGGPVDKARVLAIGDGIATDIEGAGRFGLRSVFIAGGLHAAAADDLVQAAAKLFAGSAAKPAAVMRELAW